MQNPLLSSHCLCIKFPFFNFSLLLVSFSCLCSFSRECFSCLALDFRLFVSPPSCFTVSFFFTSLTRVSFQLTLRSLFICALSRLRSLSFQPPVTRTHVPCSNLLPITLECAQSHSHVNTHLMQAVRAYTHLLGKLQRGREANHTSSPSLFSQV